MTEQPTPPIDPRFDPAFQRGYSGASGSEVRGARSSLGRSYVDRSSLTTSSLAGDATADDGTADAAAHGGGDQRAGGDATAPTGSADRGADESVMRTAFRNPFLSALAIVSVALVAGGVAAIAWAMALPNSYSGVEIPFEMLVRQVVWSITPPIVNAGLVGIIAVAIYLAFAWQRADLSKATSGRVTG